MPEAVRYAPDFHIYIDGVDARYDLGVEVLSVSVVDTSNQADSFTFTVKERHPGAGLFVGGARLQWLDSDLFREGSRVEIALGYVQNLRLMLTGDITAMSASFPEGGAPTLTVRGFSAYHRLQRERRTQPFVGETVSEVAKEIAQAMGLMSDVDPVNIKQDYKASQKETYAAILKRYADRIGYEVTVKNDELLFKKPGYVAQPDPALTFLWGRDLRSFSPSLSTYNMITKVQVKASQTSHARGKIALESTADDVPERAKMGTHTGPSVARKLNGGRHNELLFPDHNIANKEEADEVAQAQLMIKALDFISGHCVCIGNPDLMARQVVELDGLGARFSGRYYAVSATHTIDAGGYRTEFDVKRNARNGS